MSLRFIGDTPFWLGTLLALAAAVGGWFFYRRERHDLPERLRIWLPSLRAASVFLLVFVLTGPVLHHRKVIGELGRVVVLLDASQSMGRSDRQMPVARKLLIAEQQGFLSSGDVDTTLQGAVERLAGARRFVFRSLESGPPTTETVIRCRETLAGHARQVAATLDGFDWSMTGDAPTGQPRWDSIAERLREEISIPVEAMAGRPIDRPQVRESVVAEMCDRAGATRRFEMELAAACEAYGRRLLVSGRPSIAAGVADCDSTTRWQRAENALLGPADGLLARLAKTHDVKLLRLSGEDTESLWDRFAIAEPPSRLGAAPDAPQTDLGTAFDRQIAGGTVSRLASHGGGNRSAVVLLTDGRHNSGPSPVRAARLLGNQAIPIYTVGYGARREAPDLAVLEVEHPDLVFRNDRVRGSLSIKDQIAPGQSFVAQIRSNDLVLWQQPLATEDVPLRRVEFDFSVDELMESLTGRSETGITYHTLPLTLTASLASLPGETDTSNNEAEFRIAGITQKYKILLIDGRSRWETRYLRNLFERDDQWQVDTLLVGPATGEATVPRGEGNDRFPTTRSGLFRYDLIVLGEVATDVFSPMELKWMREFVESRGGGLILVDGNRGHLRLDEDHALTPLIPVAHLDRTTGGVPDRLRLTDRGGTRNAMMLAGSLGASQRLWRKLPAPKAIVPVRALPDAETVIEAVVGERTLPAMVTRRFGAGRVFYLAIDETWRWRYKAADTYHQRFWNQLARWVMPSPFAVRDEYVSIDSGPPAYATGETVSIRVQLRGTDGRPVSDATVDAVLWQGGRIVSTVHLEADETANGVYRGQAEPLAEGEYEVGVRASGFSHEALRARTTLVVEAPEGLEMKLTACNDDLLEEMAIASGGEFLREEQIDRLGELLAPLSDGRIIETEILLWQSYWWFVPIIGLLSIEWFLRKRAGLL